MHPRFGALLVVVAGLSLFGVAGAHAATNMDPAATGSARYGWGENSGWVNLHGNGTSGVEVTPDYLKGLAWIENCGWLNFGEGTPEGPGSHYTNTAPNNLTPPNFGVNNDRLGNLWGLAWSENAGWVNFGPNAAGSTVAIDPGTGRFSGNAWSENLGWLSFTGVATADVATVPVSAVPVTLGQFSAD